MNPYIAQEGGKIISDTDNLADPNKFTLQLLDFKA
jgi:cullin 3